MKQIQQVHAVSVRKKAKHIICVQHNSCTVYIFYFLSISIAAIFASSQFSGVIIL